MEIITEPLQAQQKISFLKKQGHTIGFVPTMGYLHDGHLSLVQRAQQENDIVVVSIFVNPLQFGPGEDFDAYPRDEQRDLQLLERMKTDILFSPRPEQMYSGDCVTTVSAQKLQDILCGRSRPGHFDGVTTVVAKLFNIMMPDRSYFGLKDYQQYLIIRRMVQDLNFNIEIVGCPIVREQDGLAMSSRNKYLSELERRQASCIYEGLVAAAERVLKADTLPEIVKNNFLVHINSSIDNVKVDYFEILDADTLEPLGETTRNVLLAAAVFIGKTRLIDNVVVSVVT